MELNSEDILKESYCAGNFGAKVRGDCLVTYFPAESHPLEIIVESRVQAFFGNAISALAKTVYHHFKIDTGRVRIQDSGAFDFVLTARMEACIRQFIRTDQAYLPRMLAANRYKSSKKRLRVSRLYIPGNTPKMMINAGIHKAHAVILDLEDAVAQDRKTEAAILVRNALRQVDFLGAERMVRINPFPQGKTDVEQIIAHNVHVILIPKCECPEDVAQVNDAILPVQGRNHEENPVFLIPIIESAKGILNAEKIAAAGQNIAALAIGLEDYAASLGTKRTFEGHESFYARSHLVTVCKAYGLQAIDSVFSNIGEDRLLKEKSRESKMLGFDGMGCIHPRQIRIVHQGFAPDMEETEHAKAVILAFEDAKARGLGVISLGTKMIDAPVVEQAFQTVDAAIAMGLLTKEWRKDGQQQ